MRDYSHQPTQWVEDERTRHILHAIDYYLLDLTRGMARIQKGEVPDGSGDPIADQTLSDIYFVLLGRPNDQVGHGSTRASGNLTLASTTHGIKGKILFGNAASAASGVSGMTFDETNNMFGIGTASPSARLHISSPSPGQASLPSSDLGSPGLDWGKVGAATFWQCVSDASDSTYMQWTSNLGVTTNSVRIPLDSLSDPGNSSFALVITMRAISNSTNQRMIFGGNRSVDSAAIFSSRSYGSSAHAGSPVATEGNVTSAFATYTLTVTGATGLQYGVGKAIDLTFVESGTTNAGQTWDISRIQFSAAGPGGAGSVTLQKWETLGGSTNRLDYATNIAGSTVLRVSGTPAVSFASGVEFASGSPASGMLWTSVNTDGLGRWASASSLATKVQHRFIANGPYRVDNDVDGAYIAPHALTLTTALLYRRQAGAGGTTSVDLLKNGTSVLSSLASVGASGGASATGAGTISTTSVAVGDRLTVSASSVETGRPRDWVLLIEGY